jgi:hypothetical protein
MQKRCKDYLRKKGIFKRQFAKYASLAISCATSASFPDSGYYYRGKEREAERIYERLERLCPKHWLKKWNESLAKRIERAQYNYYVKEWAFDKSGRGYTAAEMDAAMAYGN